MWMTMKKLYWILLVSFSFNALGTQDNKEGAIYEEDEFYPYMFNKTKCCVNFSIDEDSVYQPVESVRCLGEKVDYQDYFDWNVQNRVYVPFTLEDHAIDKSVFRYYNSKIDIQDSEATQREQKKFMSSQMKLHEVVFYLERMVSAQRLYVCPESRRASIRKDKVDEFFPFLSIKKREALRRFFGVQQNRKRFEPYTGIWVSDQKK